MQAKTYNLFSLTMAILIFFSSSGMSMDIHFCQGKIKRINLFGKAKTCAEVSQNSTKCHTTINTTSTCGIDSNHNGCCNNQSFELDFDFDFGDVMEHNFTDSQLKFVTALVYNYLGLKLPKPNLNNYTSYHPPSLRQNFIVLFQTFLL